MTTSPDTFGLSSAALPLLRDLVHERLGLYYDEGRLAGLAERIGPLVVERSFHSYLDYYYFLKYDRGAEAEWLRLIDVLSVPETYFWREIDQLKAVVEIVVPSLVRELRGRPLHIWSVPCASGEEPLTIAMLLDQAGWFDRAAIEIHAADASPSVLERAKAGRYRERSFRSIPLAVKERYFRNCGDSWMVDSLLHARVRSWRVMNLVSEDDVAKMAGAPVVFCRNVFIYFSESGVRRVIDHLSRLMPAPGFLCVGASESLLRVTTRFELEELGGSFMYVKRR
jgi:chemotaxis protein methyltransferase CheR